MSAQGAGSVEAQLRESQARFRSFIANTRDAVWCYECPEPIPLSLSVEEQFEQLLGARLVECNQAYARMRGVPAFEAIAGQELRAVSRASVELLRVLYRRLVESGFVLDEAHLQQQAPDGSQREVEGRVHGVREGGRLVRVWGSFADVTDRVRAERDREALEAQLRHAQKMEAIGALAGGMAHDFNNVLAAIYAEADLALEAMQRGKPERALESMEIVRSSAERGATLTRRLLTFARRSGSSRRETRIDQLVHELWPMVRSLIPETIALHLETPEPLWAVVDPGQIEQVLVNLVVNARDAIGKAHGVITLRSDALELTEAQVRGRPWARPGPYLRLAVRDSGPGIEAALHQRIFEPFFTTKGAAEGTGLGLAVVYSILQQHEGFVQLESAPGAGACFELLLPRALPTEEHAPAQGARPPVAEGGSETVLLVEDEAVVRDGARRILEGAGYRVLSAADGDEALAVLHPAARADLLLLDVVLPKRSGPQVYEALRGRVPRVLFTSGYASGELDPALVTGPGHGFLPKPYGRDALLRAVRGALDGS